MADVRPFPGLRYDARLVDPALTIAPPYDVISESEQRALYERSAYNVVRIEYGERRPEDREDREGRDVYARAAADLAAWRASGVLAIDDSPAVYAYTQTFAHNGQTYARHAVFVALRLEPWEAGVVRPHERTLSNPKEDRMRLLRATRTQISPVYTLSRGVADAIPRLDAGEVLYDVTADGQRHQVSAMRDAACVRRLAEAIQDRTLYIADGHHRYETALAYRHERGATGDAPEAFVLAAITDIDDAGLLILPTHRLVHAQPPGDIIEQIAAEFDILPLSPGSESEALAEAPPGAIVAAGLRAGESHLLLVRDRTAVEAGMPVGEPAAWKSLDVNVLQYGILSRFGIDDKAVAAGALSYTQDAAVALGAVRTGSAGAAFLLRAMAASGMTAVADAGARMPQKSTYFYPKLPTGLVMRSLDS